jgi:citronellol/citronellal dehydrogenase
MADSAYEILRSDSKTTNDQFFIDDEVMAAVGVIDLEKYKVDSRVKDHELVIDFMC